MDPAFLHRVLLTDPSEFSSLVSSNDEYTLSFPEFTESLDAADPSSLDPDMVVKKSVRDYFVENITNQQQQQQQKPPPTELIDLLLELYQQIRLLIPNRKDLHETYLSSDIQARKDLSDRKDMQPFVANASKALLQLESESRAETTRAFLQNYLNNNSQSNGKEDKHLLIFWFTCILYLMYKTELCQKDKEQFYMIHVWAPRIHKEGPAFLKKLYQKEHGIFTDPKSSPATRQWIASLVRAHRSTQGSEPTLDENIPLHKSPEEYKNIIRVAWIEDIVFRGSPPSNHTQSFLMPEIFHRDQQALQTLREITRLAVAGCALFLHACNAAGVPLQELKIKEDNNSRYDSSYDPRNNLIRAMRERSGSQESYEKTVADAVVELATKGRSSKPMLAGSTTTEFFDIESLRSRTIAVLRGKDPVLEVLNKRIRIAVRDILAQGLHHKKNDTAAPLKMRSGLAIWNVPRDDHESGTLTAEPKDIVEKLFWARGFGAFAPELALVAKHAGKIVDLVIGLYWDDLLVKFIQDL